MLLNPKKTFANLNSAIDTLSLLAFKKCAKIIWRTGGFHGRGQETNVIWELNRLAKERIDSLSNGHFTYLDWGYATYPRSFSPNRILGDMLSHYGHEARALFLQMLTNELDTGNWY